MGRYSWSGRLTVGVCRKISTKWLKDNGYLEGSVTKDGQDLGNVCIQVVTAGWSDKHYVQFSYTLTHMDTEINEQFCYRTPIVWTPCFFGGKRPWFMCPMIHNGQPCIRRVGVLYLVGKFFGCRKCHNLTYYSAKTRSKKWSPINRFYELRARKMTPKNMELLDKVYSKIRL